MCNNMLIKPCLECFLSLYTIEINIYVFACRSIASRHLSKSASVFWRYKVDTESLTQFNNVLEHRAAIDKYTDIWLRVISI